MRTRFLAYGLLLVTLAGCSKDKQEPTQNQPAPQQPAAQQQAPQPAPQAAAPEAAPAAQQQGAPSAAAAPAPEQPAKSQPVQHTKAKAPAAKPAAGIAPVEPKTAAAPPAAPRATEVAPPPHPAVVLVPSGTRFEVRLADRIDSTTNSAGDTFQAVLDQDLEIDGKIAVPRGSAVSGKIVSAEGSGRVSGRAKMSIALTEIKVRDASYPVKTNTLSFEAEGSEKKDALKVGGGAALGAIIGAIAGGGKGAAIGAAVGGGAGAATVLVTKGKEVKFEPEQKFSFVLRDDVQIRLR